MKLNLQLRLSLTSRLCNYTLLFKPACVFLFVLIGLQLYSQQIPVYSGYYFNKFLINPGFTGIDNEYRAFGFYRTQWGSMPGHPTTGGATAEASLWKDQIGIGGYVVNDKIGIFNTVNATLSYAQKFKFAKDHQISIGAQGGVFTNRIDFSGITTADLNDPGVLEQKPVKTVFDMSVGLSYKWKGLLVGFSVPNLLQPLASYASPGLATNYEYVRHYTAFGQYKIKLLYGKFNITPQLFMRKGPATGYQFDATAMFDYNNIVFIGGGYRNAFGVIGMIGVNPFNMLTIAYAYDYTTQPSISGQVGSTHEITAGFHLPSNFKSKKRLAAEALIDKASILSLQKKTDSLAAKVDSVSQVADSLSAKANGNANGADKTNDNLKDENNRYKKIIDSLSQQIDQLLSLKSLSSEKNLKGNQYRLDKIYFDYNKYTLLPVSEGQLNDLVEFMKRFPKIHIKVFGYTDNIGTNDFNEQLSIARANAVVDYLITHGISEHRLLFQGMGSVNPVAGNETEEGRKLNRRVEFSIESQ